MKDKHKDEQKLTFAQVQSDLILARHALDDSQKSGAAMAKIMRGQAGYHLQQATEKLIKIQIYQSGKQIDNYRLYKHSIPELSSYAKSLGIDLIVPAYIRKNDEKITGWEAEGRYDVHMVVRTDTLEKTYSVVDKWLEEMKGKHK